MGAALVGAMGCSGGSSGSPQQLAEDDGGGTGGLRRRLLGRGELRWRFGQRKLVGQRRRRDRHQSSGGASEAGSGSGGVITPPAFRSNTPSLTFTNMTSSSVGALVLISWNIVEQADSGGNYYTQWFGEVENVSSKLYCAVNIKIPFVSDRRNDDVQFVRRRAALPCDGAATGTDHWVHRSR